MSKFQDNNQSTSVDTLFSQNGTKTTSPEDREKELDLDISQFEKDVILKPSPIWSRTIAWSIIGVTVFAVGWASVAQIEQVVTARGQLKPKTTVKEIQSPVNGIVQQVNVQDGQKIKEGESMIVFDSSASEAQLTSLEKIRNSLEQENKFYQTLLNSGLTSDTVEATIVRLNIPPEIAALALNRSALVSENQLFKIQLSQSTSGISKLKADQIARLEAAFSELNSRAKAAELEMNQLEKQLNQNQVQSNDAKKQLANDRAVLAQIQQRNQKTIAQAEESLRIEEGILNTVTPLGEEGALAKIQIERQRQQVQDRRRQLTESKANGQIEYDNQKQQVETRIAQIQQLEEERGRLILDIDQAREQLNNTIAISEKDVRDRMAENQKQIAEIDSQINKLIVENDKRLAEVKSQISAAEQTIKYQEIKAPVSGTVFDLKAGPGFVPKSGQAEALLKIVPDVGNENPLIAEVYVTNQDIGFVREGQITDVRIDSFPYSEFGDIKGKVYLIGSDALPPDEIYNFYRFPVKVELDSQKLVIRNQPKELQSGMSVSVNIKVKENRTVLSLFTELFTKKVDSLKNVR
jgi:HlyD family secretion protein